MQFSISHENLTRALKRVGKVAMHKGAPLFGVANNILVEATAPDTIIFTATNFDVAVQVAETGNVYQAGAACLPADLLLQLVPKLAADSAISFTLNTRTLDCTMTSAESVSEIKTLPTDQFPIIAQFQGDELFEMDATKLQEMTEQVIFAAAKEDNRPVLTGINFILSEEGLTLQAADGYRLAVRRASYPVGSSRMIVPVATLRLLNSAIQEDQQLVVRYNPMTNRIAFLMPGYQLITTLIEGTFPDIDAIIPQNFTTTITVSIAELLQAAYLAQPFAYQVANKFVMVVSNGELRTSATSQERGQGATTLTISQDGEDITTFLNVQYLIQFLESCTEEPTVEIRFKGGATPMYFSPCRPHQFSIIMPMSVGR